MLPVREADTALMKEVLRPTWSATKNGWPVSSRRLRRTPGRGACLRLRTTRILAAHTPRSSGREAAVSSSCHPATQRTHHFDRRCAITEYRK